MEAPAIAGTFEEIEAQIAALQDRPRNSEWCEWTKAYVPMGMAIGID